MRYETHERFLDPHIKPCFYKLSSGWGLVEIWAKIKIYFIIIQRHLLSLSDPRFWHNNTFDHNLNHHPKSQITFIGELKYWRKIPLYRPDSRWKVCKHWTLNIKHLLSDQILVDRLENIKEWTFAHWPDSRWKVCKHRTLNIEHLLSDQILIDRLENIKDWKLNICSLTRFLLKGL